MSTYRRGRYVNCPVETKTTTIISQGDLQIQRSKTTDQQAQLMGSSPGCLKAA